MTTAAQKLEKLRFHAGLRPDAPAPPKAAVTEQFRPYKGQLDTDALQDVVELAKDIELESAQNKNLRVPTALALWVLAETVERWALDAGGMLQRNRLITVTDADRVRMWVSELHDIGCRLLEKHLETDR